MIRPILVRPQHRIRDAAAAAGIDISPYPLVDAPHSHAAADRAVPAGQRTSVEVITRGAARAYHVKKRDRDARYKIEIELDGTVVRAVREARAEIEIPLVSR